MGLQTTGTVSVDVDRATAFAFVANPAQLAECIPGCQGLSEISPGRYAAELTSKVAFITLKFKVISEIVRMEPPHVIEAKMTGASVGLAGHVVATAALELLEAGERRTDIRYVADVALTGKLGGLGQPVFRAKSIELAREFGENLKTAIENRAGQAQP